MEAAMQQLTLLHRAYQLQTARVQMLAGTCPFHGGSLHAWLILESFTLEDMSQFHFWQKRQRGDVGEAVRGRLSTELSACGHWRSCLGVAKRT